MPRKKHQHFSCPCSDLEHASPNCWNFPQSRCSILNLCFVSKYLDSKSIPPTLLCLYRMSAGGSHVCTPLVFSTSHSSAVPFTFGHLVCSGSSWSCLAAAALTSLCRVEVLFRAGITTSCIYTGCCSKVHQHNGVHKRGKAVKCVITSQ